MGRVPTPFKIGSSLRWLRSEIDEWLASGAPERREWERRKQAAR
jgi:predicted DNA-binding transcriptional regulator AlpA